MVEFVRDGKGERMSNVPGADAREPGAQAWAGEREAGPCSLPVLVDAE